MLPWFLVQEQSMEPLVYEGDFVFADNMSYRLFKPRVGQVVIARHPLKQGILLLKRIVKEQQGFYWIEGDNAEKSVDSRHFGWLQRELILGKVIHRTGPFESSIMK